MLERRNGSRALESLASRRLREGQELARRDHRGQRAARLATADYWEGVAREREEREGDAKLVADWLARFAEARNALCA